jgi:nitric oxide reductase NorD protein
VTMLALAPDSRVCFGDIQNFIRLFAQGIAGRYLHAKPNEGAVLSRSYQRMPEPDQLHLPAQIADFSSAEHNLGAYRIAVLQQISYLLEGTFDFDLSRLAPSPVDARQPSSRSDDLSIAGFFATSSRPALLRRLFVIIEDLRIQGLIRRRYPGARADLDRVLAHSLAARRSISGMRPASGLIEALLHYSLGTPREVLLDSDSTGSLARLLEAALWVRKEDATVYDSARTARYICDEIEGLLRRPSARVPVRLAEEDPPGFEAQADASMGHDLAADEDLSLANTDGVFVGFRAQVAADQLFGQRRTSVKTSAMPAMPPLLALVADAGKQPDESRTQSRVQAQARIGAGANEKARSFLYDEWDYHQQSYLSAWCTVYEHRLHGEDFGFIHDVRRRHSILISQVRRQFTLVKPQSWHRVHRSSDGDELELDSIIEAVIDRRCGHANDAHLYLRRERARRDVAAAFLIDMSASTDFPVREPSGAVTASEPSPDSGPYLYGGHAEPPDPPAAPRRRVIDVSKDALGLMCDALQTLGDSFAIYGFSGEGRDNVEVHVAKDFSDKLTARTWAALSAMQPRRSTRMGAAIRHAISKLSREAASTKVLIIVSDGYPEDQDYGPDRDDREYGIQDTARALQETKRAGIVDFCVTIDPAGHDYLRRMCADSRYLVIDDVTALPRALTKVYRTLTAQR